MNQRPIKPKTKQSVHKGFCISVRILGPQKHRIEKKKK